MQLFCSSRVGVSNPLTGQRLIGAKTCLGLFNGQLCLPFCFQLCISTSHFLVLMMDVQWLYFSLGLGSVGKQRLSHTTHP